jgi:crotonobetainyl-CoA:carnitine CoA-transferase CaiB-like acyl-CoA transferase
VTNSDTVPATGPLAGIRIVDLTSVVFGPYATQMLGDAGAEIIKVEPPEGDIMRAAAAARSPGMGAVFLNANRNKRSIVLDLKQPAAREALLKIAATADVFIHSLRPQAIRKLGLAYADLAAVRPDIIYCSAWGFWSKGPYAERPAYDDVIQGMSGTADLVRKRGAETPDFAPMVMADKISGLHAVAAVSMALVHRARTGQGQEVEIPMLESVTSFNLVEHLAGAVFDPPEGPMGYNRVLVPDRKPHRTKDGFMVVLPYTNRQWRAFFETAGRDDMRDDPRLDNAVLRAKQNAEMYQMIAEIMPTRTTAKWERTLGAADVPCVRVNSLEDLEHDPHLIDTGFFKTYDHPTEGRLKTTDAPLKFGASPAQAVRRAPPRLGQHSREILNEAGLPEAEIDRLMEAGAAHQASAPDRDRD